MLIQVIFTRNHWKQEQKIWNESQGTPKNSIHAREARKKKRLVPDFSKNDKADFLPIANQAVVGLISKISKYNEQF